MSCEQHRITAESVPDPCLRAKARTVQSTLVFNRFDPRRLCVVVVVAVEAVEAVVVVWCGRDTNDDVFFHIAADLHLIGAAEHLPASPPPWASTSQRTETEEAPPQTLNILSMIRSEAPPRTVWNLSLHDAATSTTMRELQLRHHHGNLQSEPCAPVIHNNGHGKHEVHNGTSITLSKTNW